VSASEPVAWIEVHAPIVAIWVGTRRRPLAGKERLESLRGTREFVGERMAVALVDELRRSMAE
jgi:hypothetical protein